MCATWWKRIPERSVYERPSSVTIGKVCHRKVNVYTSLSAEENVFFVVVGGSRDPCHTRFPLSFHPMYRHIVRTLFNRFANIRPFFYFCKQREKERDGERKEFFLRYLTLEIDFPFDSFVFLLHVPLFCLPCFLDRINQRQSVLFYNVAPVLFLHCWAKIKEILLI